MSSRSTILSRKALALSINSSASSSSPLSLALSALLASIISPVVPKPATVLWYPDLNPLPALVKKGTASCSSTGSSTSSTSSITGGTEVRFNFCFSSSVSSLGMFQHRLKVYLVRSTLLTLGLCFGIYQTEPTYLFQTLHAFWQ